MRSDLAICRLHGDVLLYTQARGCRVIQPLAKRAWEGDEGSICPSMPSCKGEEGEEGTSDGGGSSLSSQNGLSTVGVEGVKGLGLRWIGLVLRSESDPEPREPLPFLASRCRMRRPALGDLIFHGGVPSQATAAVMSSRRPRALVALSTTRFAASAGLAHWRVHLATWSCVSASQTPSEQMIRALPLAAMSHVTVSTEGTAEMAAPTSASPIARQTAKPPG